MVRDVSRRLPWLSAVVLLLALTAIVMALPSLPAAWAGITNLSRIGDNGAGELGYVTVSACERGTLHFDWTCHGTFQVNDPMAESYAPTRDVSVVNDSGYHARSAQVSSTLAVHSRRAYVYGGTQQFVVLVLWAGLALCILAAVLALFRLRRGWVAAPVGAVLGGALLLAATGSLL
jgi:hypothetical protein